MKKRFATLVCSAVLCSIPAAASATPLQECASAAAPSACLDAKLKEANQRLNAALKAAQGRIEQLQNEGRRSVQNAFVNSQRTFNAYRDAQCAWQSIRAAPGSSGVDYVKDCQIRVTVAREQELMAFARGDEPSAAPESSDSRAEPAAAETKTVAQPPAEPEHAQPAGNEVAAAKPAEPQAVAPPRAGAEWQLSQWTANGVQRPLVPDSNISVAFDPSGKIAGNASVNRFSGTYRFDADGRLLWPGTGFSLTRMAGPPELMAQERAFLESLRRTAHYRADGRQLVLESANGSIVLTFRKSKGER